MAFHKNRLVILVLFAHYFFQGDILQAQTSNDAIMMNKYQWCNGATFSQSKWENYWEKTFFRNNANLGQVTTRAAMAMTNYGITDQLNIMACLPYIWTDASKGTLHGLKGFQDLSLFLKWRALTKNTGLGKFSVFAIGGITKPTNNYLSDFLPMSIGLGTTNVTGRLMGYFRRGIFFIRASGSYVWRSNISIDQTSYYTTTLQNTNQVQMPNQAFFNGSFGIYDKYLIAEIMVDRMWTLGGFDMRKNDMPFPSNSMQSLSLGTHIKYTLPFDPHISIVGAADYTLRGRNVGQATGLSLGCFYAFYFKKGSNVDANSPKN